MRAGAALEDRCSKRHGVDVIITTTTVVIITTVIIKVAWRMLATVQNLALQIQSLHIIFVSVDTDEVYAICCIVYIVLGVVFKVMYLFST